MDVFFTVPSLGSREARAMVVLRLSHLSVHPWNGSQRPLPLQVQRALPQQFDSAIAARSDQFCVTTTICDMLLLEPHQLFTHSDT